MHAVYMQEGVACWGAEQRNYLRMSKMSSTGPAQPPQSAQTTAVFCVQTCLQMRTIAPWFLPTRSRVNGSHDNVVVHGLLEPSVRAMYCLSRFLSYKRSVWVIVGTCVELLNLYLGKLEDTPLDRSEDTYRTISMVHQLLHSFNGDMEPAFRADMIVFLCDIFPKLHDLRLVASLLFFAG